MRAGTDISPETTEFTQVHKYPREVLGEKHGSKVEPADTNQLWEQLDKKMLGFLKTLTLADFTSAAAPGQKSRSSGHVRDLASIT